MVLIGPGQSPGQPKTISLLIQKGELVEIYRLDRYYEGDDPEWLALSTLIKGLTPRQGGIQDRTLRVILPNLWPDADHAKPVRAIFHVEAFSTARLIPRLHIEHRLVIPVIGREVISTSKLFERLNGGAWSLGFGWPHLVYRADQKAARDAILRQKKFTANVGIKFGIALIEFMTAMAVPISIARVANLYEQKYSGEIHSIVVSKSVRAFLAMLTKEVRGRWAVIEKIDPAHSRNLLTGVDVSALLKVMNVGVFNTKKQFSRFISLCDEIELNFIVAAEIDRALSSGGASGKEASHSLMDAKIAQTISLFKASDRA